MKRVESLDYLRGLLALSVMVYHYASTLHGFIGPEHVLGRLGIYAVSAFYILSGLSLGLVYRGRIETVSDVRAFAIKRVFRIAPLFWIAVTAGILTATEPLTTHDILLNYTLTFGFLEPATYFTTGAWSIGNEMVFYAMFPLMMVRSVRPWLIGSVTLGLAYAFVWMDAGTGLITQWRMYVDPLNQLFLFVAGVAIAKADRLQVSRQVAGSVMVVAAAAFCLYPMQGLSIVQVTGMGRVVMSSACICFVWGLYYFNPQIRGLVGKALGLLGQGSYSVYLLHPLIALAFPHTLAGQVTAGCTTLVVAFVTFRCIEQPMMRVGSRVSTWRPVWAMPRFGS